MRTVVVTGEAHTLDFAARLELEDGDVDAADLLAADPTDRHLDAVLDPAADLAHLAYTGGTTGVSKGVELPHRNVVTNVLQSACWTSGSLPELDEAGRRDRAPGRSARTSTPPGSARPGSST